MNKFTCEIIVVSFNTKGVTDICLQKSEAAAEYLTSHSPHEASITVVDNGSSDGTVEMIRSKYPRVNLIALAKNAGYAKANNLAMKSSSASLLLLINSDVYLEKDTLLKSLEYLNQNPKCDILCCRILNAKGELDFYGGYLPTPFKIIRWIFGFESIPMLKNFIRKVYHHNRAFYSQERQSEWCPTCFFLLRRKVYDATGGFDENLFLYMEDVEWCKRIQDKHFSIWCVPSIQAVHLGGASTKVLPTKESLQRHVEGIKYYFQVHYPDSKLTVYRFLKFGLKMREIFYGLAGHKQTAEAYRQIQLELL